MSPIEPRRILVLVTGGIAAYKVPELVRALRADGHAVRCALTPEAARFVSPLVLQTLTGEPVRRFHRAPMFSRSILPASSNCLHHAASSVIAEATSVPPILSSICSCGHSTTVTNGNMNS